MQFYTQKIYLKIGFLLIGWAITFFISLNESHAFSSHFTAIKIFDILTHYRLDYDIDLCIGGQKCPVKPEQPSGKEEFILKIEAFVKQGKTLEFFLPSFPFKSPNRQARCLGLLPDMAERKALEFLNKILTSIREIYPHGSHLTLLADGQFFSDCLGIQDKEITLYEDALKKIGSDLTHITILTVSDLMKTSSPHEARQHLEQSFPISQEELEQSLQPQDFDKEKAKNSDDLPQVSAEHLTKVTYATLKRNYQLRSYLKSYLSTKEHLRLSVHYAPNISEKFGLKLSENSKTTPWFGVAVLKADKTWEFMPKSAVNGKVHSLKLHMINGIPCTYYQEGGK